MASNHLLKDLFWGIKGAGACFGVVTSFKFKLVSSTSVYAGPIIFPFSRYQYNCLFQFL